jgi:hypothetical protein
MGATAISLAMAAMLEASAGLVLVVTQAVVAATSQTAYQTAASGTSRAVPRLCGTKLGSGEGRDSGLSLKE